VNYFRLVFILDLPLQVVNKWFALQAVSDIAGNVENVRKLLNHPAFDLRNPNKVYSLIGGFCGSPVNFHAKDGSGYQFLGDIVLQLDKINPQVSSHYPSLNYGFCYSHVR
jgi:aminopeptidase N